MNATTYQSLKERATTMFGNEPVILNNALNIIDYVKGKGAQNIEYLSAQMLANEGVIDNAGYEANMALVSMTGSAGFLSLVYEVEIDGEMKAISIDQVHEAEETGILTVGGVVVEDWEDKAVMYYTIQRSFILDNMKAL